MQTFPRTLSLPNCSRCDAFWRLHKYVLIDLRLWRSFHDWAVFCVVFVRDAHVTEPLNSCAVAVGCGGIAKRSTCAPVVNRFMQSFARFSDAPSTRSDEEGWV